jgi:hypothetical protein
MTCCDHDGIAINRDSQLIDLMRNHLLLAFLVLFASVSWEQQPIIVHVVPHSV